MSIRRNRRDKLSRMPDPDDLAGHYRDTDRVEDLDDFNRELTTALYIAADHLRPRIRNTENQNALAWIAETNRVEAHMELLEAVENIGRVLDELVEATHSNTAAILHTR